MRIKLVAINGRYVHSCPALFYVRSELSRRLPGFTGELLQFTINDSYYATLNRILAGESEAFFFSVYIWNSGYVRRLIVDLRRAAPEIPIVVGGPQAPFLFGAPGRTGSAGHLCTLVKGEIEGVGQEFYDDLAVGALKPEYVGAEGALFDLPFRKEDFAGQLANRYIYYESSRGCPFACAYCLSANSPGPRHKGLEQVRQELGLILAQNPKTVRFVDRTFNDNRDRALAIWRFLAQQDPGTMCHFEVAPDLFNEKIFQFLAALTPGRFQFEIGVQSCNPEALNAVNRRMAVADALANIKRLALLDTVHIHVDLILGLPFETRETFEASFNKVFACLPHYIQMGLLKVLPETPLAARVEEYGLLCCQEPPYEIMATRWLARRELADLYWFGECVETFFNNRFFRSLWQYLVSRQEDGCKFFQELLAVCRQHGFFELAPTQKLMDRMLRELVDAREDGELLGELLTLDWLRSGQRLLPDHLAGEEPLSLVKDRLWKHLPQNMAGLYDYKSRDEFFKRTIFKSFSAAALEAAGLVTAPRLGSVDVAFLSEKEAGVFGRARTVVLPRF